MSQNSDLQVSTSRVFQLSSGLQGTTAVPGDKSITHRAILLGLLASGTTTIQGWLDAEDCRSSLRVGEQLGARVQIMNDLVRIDGTGGELQEPIDVLDCGNSGTTIRLLLGVLAAKVPFACVSGDASLRGRPMRRVINPLLQMGASVQARAKGFAPLSVSGQKLHGIQYEMPVASAQVKSAILLAGILAADGSTTVTEGRKSRDHTETMLKAFGASICTDTTADGHHRITVDPQQTLLGTSVVVPGDLSSAAFLLAAGAIVPNSRVTIAGVGLNPTRSGLLNVMGRMGIQTEIQNLKTVSGEVMGDVTVTHGTIRPVRISCEEIPSLIDELPIIAVLAAYANGRTVVEGAEELRVKETDRISTIVLGLRQIGVNALETEDGFVIEGNGTVTGGRVDSFDDHRIAMSFAVAGLASQTGVRVDRWSAVNISFPNFASILEKLGAISTE